MYWETKVSICLVRYNIKSGDVKDGERTYLLFLWAQEDRGYR